MPTETETIEWAKPCSVRLTAAQLRWIRLRIADHGGTVSSVLRELVDAKMAQTAD